jgi:hypothetical protein
MSKPLLRKLRRALERIESGGYVTEKEFAKRVNLKSH